MTIPSHPRPRRPPEIYASRRERAGRIPALAAVPEIIVKESYFSGMPPLFDTPGFHHIGLRCGDLARSRHFYGTVLGFPVLRAEPILVFQAGSAIIAMKGPEAASPPGDVFNPFRIGLDHLALACRDEAELQRAAAALTAAGVEHTGVKSDPSLAGRKYMAFKDPDRIAWEFYMVA